MTNPEHQERIHTYYTIASDFAVDRNNPALKPQAAFNRPKLLGLSRTTLLTRFLSNLCVVTCWALRTIKLLMLRITHAAI